MSRRVEIAEISEMELLNAFASNLKYVMEYEGITQSELARKSGLSKSTICMYTKAKRMPSMAAIYNICFALNCRIDDLIPTTCVVIE